MFDELEDIVSEMDQELVDLNKENVDSLFCNQVTSAKVSLGKIKLLERYRNKIRKIITENMDDCR
jgi:hypothetical protein